MKKQIAPVIVPPILPFRSWLAVVAITFRRLKWMLVAFCAVFIIDGGWLLRYANTQRIVYKLAVCSIAVVFSQIVWVSVIPYLSMEEVMTGRDSEGKRVKWSDGAKIAVCIVRGLFFLAIVLAITMGL